jgi:hypothetical protein
LTKATVRDLKHVRLCAASQLIGHGSTTNLVLVMMRITLSQP